MTSANVVEYRIEKEGKQVGHFRKNLMCRLPEYSDLLKYQPLNEHQITAYGYDEDEDYWEDDSVNLEEFLKKQSPFEKVIREYFKNI